MQKTHWLLRFFQVLACLWLGVFLLYQVYVKFERGSVAQRFEETLYDRGMAYVLAQWFPAEYSGGDAHPVLRPLWPFLINGILTGFLAAGFVILNVTRPKLALLVLVVISAVFYFPIYDLRNMIDPTYFW